MDPKFLDDRMIQLGMFFNAFLSNHHVAMSKLVLTYFASKAADQESQDKIIQLNDQIQQASSQRKPVKVDQKPEHPKLEVVAPPTRPQMPEFVP